MKAMRDKDSSHRTGGVGCLPWWVAGEDPARPREERIVEPSAKVQQWGSHNDQTFRMRRK